MQVKLPETTETTPDIKDQPLQLGIDAQNRITLNKQSLADLGALEATLKVELAQNPEATVHLYADQSVVYAKVAEVMATVQHAGINKLAFVTVEQ